MARYRSGPFFWHVSRVSKVAFQAACFATSLIHLLRAAKRVCLTRAPHLIYDIGVMTSVS